MPISDSDLEKYTKATSMILHQFGFHEAVAVVVQAEGLPRGTDLHELKSLLGKELSHMKNEQRKARDPIQLVRAHEHGIIFVINKVSEVAFKSEGRHVLLQNVRWVGEGEKPKEVEVDSRLLTTAYNRARKHFSDLRRAQGLGRKKRRPITSDGESALL